MSLFDWDQKEVKYKPGPGDIGSFKKRDIVEYKGELYKIVFIDKHVYPIGIRKEDKGACIRVTAKDLKKNVL